MLASSFPPSALLQLLPKTPGVTRLVSWPGRLPSASGPPGLVPDAAKAFFYSARFLLRPHVDAALRSHGRLAVAGREARRGRCCEASHAGPLRGATPAQRAVDVRVLRSPSAGVGVCGGGFLLAA